MDYFEDLHVEAELNPGSIEEWLTIIQQGKKMDKGRRSDLSIKVKKHLSALGWLFSYAYKGKRRELRYKSPKGRWYYSLATACMSCLNENSIQQQLQIVAKSDLPCYPSKHVVLTQEEKEIKPNIVEDCDVTDSNPQEENPSSELIIIVPNVDVLDQQQKELKGETLNKEKNHSSDFIEMVLKIDVSNQQQEKRRKMSDGFHSSTPNDDEGETRPRITKSLKKNLQVIEEKNETKESLRSWRQDCDQDMNCDVCCVCHCGGDLLLCDGCPSAFHHSCIGLSNLPEEELWFCPCCCCNICGSIESQENSKLMTCGQCYRRFHLKCLKEVPCLVSCRGWFCSNQCTRVFSALQNLLGCKIVVREDEEDLVWSLIRAPNDDEHYDNEQLSKLVSAVEILHQGFVPTKDRFTRKDFVDELIFKRDRTGVARGFYIVLTERKNQPITAALIRVDKDVAEIPLVVSVSSNKRIEMCRVLLDELENKMSQMGVCRLVLPVAEEAVTTWIEQFGFWVMESWERLELVKHGMVDFVGNVMCHKFLECTD